MELFRAWLLGNLGAGLDCDVIAAINLYAHECTVTEPERRGEYERSHPGFGDQTPATDDGVSRRQHGGADALSTGGNFLGGQLRQGNNPGLGGGGEVAGKVSVPKNLYGGDAATGGPSASRSS